MMETTHGRGNRSMNDEAGRQFIDTNILVYAHDATAGQKHETAKSLIQSLWHSREGTLSIQVLQEFFVTITKKIAYPYNNQEAAKIIEDLSTWHIHSPSITDILAATEIQTRYQLSFWDSMIIHSANTLGCGVLWTEDLNNGQIIHQTTIRNPFS